MEMPLRMNTTAEDFFGSSTHVLVDPVSWGDAGCSIFDGWMNGRTDMRCKPDHFPDRNNSEKNPEISVSPLIVTRRVSQEPTAFHLFIC